MLNEFSQQHHQAGHPFDNAETDQPVKLLDIQWIPLSVHPFKLDRYAQKEFFVNSINCFFNYTLINKNNILFILLYTPHKVFTCSEVYMLQFDPLGLITPVTFFAKCLLQELWKLIY